MLDENDTPDDTTTGSTGSTGTTSPPPDGSEGSAPDVPTPTGDDPAPVKKAVRRTRKVATTRTTKKAAQPAKAVEPAEPTEPTEATEAPVTDEVPVDLAPGAEEADTATAPVKRTAARKTAAKKTTTPRKTAAKRTTKKAATAAADEPMLPGVDAGDEATTADTGSGVPADGGKSQESGQESAPAPATSLVFKAPAAPRRRSRAASQAPVEPDPASDTAATAATEGLAAADDADTTVVTDGDVAEDADASSDASPVTDGSTGTEAEDSDDTEDSDDSGDGSDDETGGNRRRRRRGGRRRRRGGSGGGGAADEADSSPDDDSESSDGDRPTDGAGESRRGGRGQNSGGQNGGGQNGGGQNGQQSGRSGRGGRNQNGQNGPDASAEDQADADSEESAGTRRRRRRRRAGEEGDSGADEPGTVVRVRKPRSAEDEITSLHGSTRLEAKKQRRREGREAGRRRAPIVSEAEFLARREAVDRVMVVRQKQDLTQIAVLEDKLLVEHYVARESQTSLIGNVYLGRVQNVLPSMEAAFIDIGKGRNAVLYAGEVNWDSLGAGNGPRKIEAVLKSGQPILVQVSKDPIGHKGARLTSQVSLPGRFLVYVPDGTTSGISRKLPDTERSRLKALLKEIVPSGAGVIVRTAAEGATEEELTLDVERLTARWAEIESKIEQAPKSGGGPQLLYGEPDLTLKVVRDLFTEDFGKLVVAGDDAWNLVSDYVRDVAPDLEERLERYDGDEDIFGAYRIDEQIAKGLDRKVWLPSGGSLVIDRTEAMTVVDVNTGKFTGSGGNLEETVTKNNLESAEEIVRQLRLRDIGGIIVVDFIDMVLESNRDLVLRRLVECLGRDRTRHQVAEVTSLGLVQMTRKRIGTGLLESFSENCEHCQGRGVVIGYEPVEPRKQVDEEPRRGGGRRGRGRDGESTGAGSPGGSSTGGSNGVRSAPSPKDIAAMARHEPRPTPEPSEAAPVETAPVEPAAVESAPVESVPVEPAPVEPAAVESVPVESVPVESAAVQPAAVETAAVEADESVTTPSYAPDAALEDVAPAAAGPQVTSQPEEPDTGAESVPVEPPAAVVATGPRVVTSTRRRAVRRPAGSAEVSTPEAPATSPDDAVAASAPTDQSTDHSSDPAESAEPAPVEPTAPVVTAPPRQVTSRRRAARRPAGPPVGETPES